MVLPTGFLGPKANVVRYHALHQFLGREVADMGMKPRGIDPTQGDIGRKVVYRAAPNYEPEEGVITSFNDRVVFVRYGSGVTSAATERCDLDWIVRSPQDK
jgi:hypothetical protein